MKIKNIQVLLADKALEKIIELNLPLNVKTNYKLAQICMAIKEKAAIVEMARDQLLTKHSITPGQLDPNNPTFAPFFKEWREMADYEVEIEVDKIKLEELDVNGANVPIQVLRDLNPFIEK